YVDLSTTAVSLFPYLLHYTPPTHIYPLSLHDALPIFWRRREADHARRTAGRDDAAAARPEAPAHAGGGRNPRVRQAGHRSGERLDRKSTRLNSSHVKISYAVFCLKKKKKHLIIELV